MTKVPRGQGPPRATEVLWEDPGGSVRLVRHEYKRGEVTVELVIGGHRIKARFETTGSTMREHLLAMVATLQR